MMRLSQIQVRIWLLVAVSVAGAAAQAHAPSNQKKYVISGTVVDSVHGGVLPEIEVSIREAEGDSPLRAVVTGDDGHFEFRDLPHGKYGLNAHGRGYVAQAFQEHGGYSTAIATGEGLKSEGLVFSLKPEASISGTLTDDYNEPVSQAQVMLFVTGLPGSPETVFERGQIMSDDAGHYRFGHLPEGKYYVVVSAQPWYARSARGDASAFIRQEQDSGNIEVDAESSDSEVQAAPGSAREATPIPAELNVAYQTTYYPNVTDAEQATPLLVKSGDRALADFHLFAVPAAHLRFRGTPPTAKRQSVFPSLQEHIFGTTRNLFSVRVDPNGVAEFAGIAPGHYVLELPANGGASAQQVPLDITGDMEIGSTKGMEPTTTVTGIVQFDSGGAPGSQAYIRLINLRSGEDFGGVVSAKGGFKIEGGVRPAAYNVSLLNMENYVVKSIAATGAKVNGHQIEIPQGSSVRLTVVLTKSLARIDGLALSNGKPASQTAIFLVPDDPAHNLSLFRRDQSDSDGTFTLRQVVPGNYTLISIAEGWDLEWTDPAVLKPYLAHGVKVRVDANQKYQLKVDVQPHEATATAEAK